MSYTIRTSSGELYHHGVKGQMWGVRNGPPYPIEDKVLKSGTKLNSVSSKYISSDAYKNSDNWMYTYRKDEEWDNAVYKGPFSKYLALYRGARFIREHEFETVKDLKMPTKNERISEFKDLFNDKKFGKYVKQDIREIQKALVYQKVGSEDQQKAYKNFNINKCKTSEDFKVAYEMFNHAMEAVHRYKSTMEYAKRMSKKYDAMVDDNNQGIYNNAHDPIIIFRAKEALKDVSDMICPKFLTGNDIIENYNKVKSELEKQGKRVQL